MAPPAVHAAGERLRVGICGAELLPNPFSHLVLAGVFDGGFADLLRRSMPSHSSFDAAPEPPWRMAAESAGVAAAGDRLQFWITRIDKSRTTADNDVWTALIHRLSDGDVVTAIQQKFELPEETRLEVSARIVIERGATHLPSHADRAHKAATMIYYIGSDDREEDLLGTTLGSAASGAAIDIPYIRNSCVMFACEPDAVHGVRLHQAAVRRTLQVFWSRASG